MSRGAIVTGPSSVYVAKGFRQVLPASGLILWPNPQGYGYTGLFGEDMGGWDGGPPVPYFTFNFSKARTIKGKPAVRKAVDMWNEAAPREVLEMTKDREEADVIVRKETDKEERGMDGRSFGFPANSPWSEDDQDYGEVAISPSALQNPSTIAHELGHSQGMQHLNLDPRPGIMRYGYPSMIKKGGGEHTYNPQPHEGKTMAKRQARGTADTWNADKGAQANASQFNKAAKKQSKKPARERKVTGGRKVMQ